MKCTHIRISGPTGQSYYYNPQTKESTYIRPLPTFLTALPAQAVTNQPKKKEKPLVKTPIPGTEWIRVKTTAGNVFYTHKAKKTSVWTIPDEIKDAVEQLETEEGAKSQLAVEEELRAAEEKARRDEEVMREVERIKAEVSESVGKRKAEEPVPVDEVVISKKARVEDEEEDQDEEEEGDDDDDDDESEEEEWQREAAAQLAAEAEEEKRKQEEAKKRLEEEQAKELEAQKNRPLNMPDRVDLSIDEAKALFKVCALLLHTRVSQC